MITLLGQPQIALDKHLDKFGLIKISPDGKKTFYALEGDLLNTKMSMATTHVFGQKENFAIEIEIINWPKRRGQCRLWIEGFAMGEFKVSHEFKYFVSGLKKLLKTEAIQYPDSFLGKTPEQILTYCCFLEKEVLELTDAELAHMEKFLPYSIFLGDQLDSVTQITYVDEKLYHFIWLTDRDYSGSRKRKKHEIFFAHASIGTVHQVISDFLIWYENYQDEKPPLSLN